MRIVKLGIALFVCLIGSTSAQAYYKYDYQSGNSYNVNEYGDETHIQGYNYNTGSSWNSTIDRQGNQRGMDSSGNSWNYNADTGYYWNSDGTTCVGKGYARTCS